MGPDRLENEVDCADASIADGRDNGVVVRPQSRGNTDLIPLISLRFFLTFCVAKNDFQKSTALKKDSAT